MVSTDRKDIVRSAPSASSSRFDPVEKKEVMAETYSYFAGEVPVNIKISRTSADYVPSYTISIPLLAEGTKIMLNALKGDLITQVKLDISELLDPRAAADVKVKFEQKASELIDQHFTGLTPDKKRVLMSYLIQSTLGLGELEIMMADDSLEDIVINGPNDPVWVFHKKHGWCKTNMWIRRNETIYDYSAMVGRKVGRQINILNPVMDATLPSGDRINATLSPISNFGNTISIRKFARNPWTIPVMIDNHTVSSEVAALVWLCVQNELSLIVAGGSGSGKTSMLNAICCMIPPNQRIVSIEDTRELTLPQYLHWVPMMTRESNPEGKGGIEMIDLLVNSLRMRPDRILVGEVRRQREAEVLFEAMHTGHSVYATVHADNSSECITRLTTPPINLPKSVIPALAAIVVQYRNRRTGFRRTLQFAEVTEDGDAHDIYQWDPREDQTNKIADPERLAEILALYTGMTQKEMDADLSEKNSVLKWMVQKRYLNTDIVGKITADYYIDPEDVVEAAKKGKDWS